MGSNPIPDINRKGAHGCGGWEQRPLFEVYQSELKVKLSKIEEMVMNMKERLGERE